MIENLHMPSKQKWIPVKSQVPGDNEIKTHKNHKPIYRGLRNALKSVEVVYRQYKRNYPIPKKVHIWLEYEGQVLDFYMAWWAVWGEFG